MDLKMPNKQIKKFNWSFTSSGDVSQGCGCRQTHGDSHASLVGNTCARAWLQAGPILLSHSALGM